MKFYSSVCCDKCGQPYLISGNKVICIYCDTEDLLDEQTTIKTKRKKPHQNISNERPL